MMKGRTGGSMKSLDDLLVHELGDLLTAEKHFLKALGTMAKDVTNQKVKSRIDQHMQETEGHIGTIGEAFRALNKKEKAEKCPGATGIVDEYKQFKSEERPAKTVLEAFDLGAALRGEHYEIAAYRATIKVAEAVGQHECAELLKRNLAEEESMAQFLENSAAPLLQDLNARQTAVTAP